jgi:2-polyprenyl-6-methoxyphenol hydroxylase-like FAD-dependent oxidoreductase
MSASGTFDVVIVGAGVGGAALALGLGHAYPLRTLILERQPGPGKINRGDSLLPAVTRQLSAWNALERFQAAGARPLAKMQIFHHRAGLLLETPLTALGSPDPYLVLPHPAIERTFIECALATKRVRVDYGCRVVRLLEEGSRVSGVAYVGPEGEEKTVGARLVVGADGSRSVVRSGLGIRFERVPYDHSYFGMELDRPREYEDAMRIELHPDGGILIVPNPSSSRVGIGVLVRRGMEDVFSNGRMDDPMAEIRRRSRLFEGCHPVAKSSHLYRLSRAHAAQYVARGAVLLGDAAHVTNPTAGQGMTMAVEDAAALARYIGPALVAGKEGQELDFAFQGYESERRAANAAMIRWSHWMSLFYAWPNALGDWLRHRVFAFGGSPMGRMLHKAIWNRVACRTQYGEAI